MRIVIAPDSLKGSMAASDAAAVIAHGWCCVRPADSVRVFPMADGGEGTIDAIEATLPGRAARMPITVIGPDCRDVDTTWLFLDPETPQRSVAVVELANTSGITLLDRLRPWDSHTYGFGQAISAALDSRPSELVLALGGSASTDGGHGALTALGARFSDSDGRDVGLGNSALARIAEIDVTNLRAIPSGMKVRILSDVMSPLLGPTGAAAAFGLQKGIETDRVNDADLNLARLAAALRPSLPADPMQSGAGAAGGTGFAMIAWGASVTSGSATIAVVTGLEHAIASADLVITGEGRYDPESENGKVTGHVRRLASAAHVPCALVAGSIPAAPAPGLFATAIALSDLAGGVRASMNDPKRWLHLAGSLLAEGFAA
ncbi:glycerate kinase [Herbiconiux liukaitaii]|uniref:glycerate kinase n=1 Tax=Herbiconiux liukaitaii TaxID=3342799 RepID=UPI0035B6CD72